MPRLEGNNSANDPDKKPVKSRSTFKPNFSLYQSVRFGVNTPHFAMEAVEGDHVSVRVASDVDTYSLKAPLMSPVRMHKDYFFAPTRAILPKNAELLITNPLQGEDVVAEDINCVLSEARYRTYLSRQVAALNTDLDAAINTAELSESCLYVLRALIRSLLLIEPVCSDGSLGNVLGEGRMAAPNILAWTNSVTGERAYFDEFVELACNYLIGHVASFKVTPMVLDGPTSASPNYAEVGTGDIFTVNMSMDSDAALGSTRSFRQFVELVRQGMVPWTITDLVVSSDPIDEVSGLYDIESNPVTLSLTVPTDASTRYINVSRIVAYQLACAQFYTNDAVDDVYSPQLWHRNMEYFAAVAATSGYIMPPVDFYFTLNGVSYMADSVAGLVLDKIFSLTGSEDPMDTGSATTNDITVTLFNPDSYAKIAYLINLFGYTRSLKFRDYFCGSKASPLAVGDVEVAVSDSSFSVVDVTKNIQMQRFLNQVNRVGRKFKDYVQGIFGVIPARDPHELVFLGTSMDIIGAEETENTGTAQLTVAQTVTSKLRKNSSQFAFEGDFNDSGVMIGIIRFDVVRPYLDSVDRQLFHIDRFDMFNPYLQQIGDQEVYLKELNARLPGDYSFGYQLRYSEFKQRVDRAVGAFRKFLPGYAFVNNEGYYLDSSASIEISSDFIRSQPAEFDRFYISLVNYSLAGYFHFIIRQDIDVTAKRNMEAAPTIL